MTQIEQEFIRMIDLARQEPKNLSAMGLKLFEEGGEVSEAINYKLGNLPHKKMKEPLSGEVADVINVALTILVKAYHELSNEEIIQLLNQEFNRKSDKWEKIINEHPIAEVGDI